MSDKLTKTPITHEIIINNMAGKFLSDMLNSTDWTRSTSDVILAGQILFEKLPDDLSKTAVELSSDEVEFTKWIEKKFSFVLTEKQREVCKYVIEKFSKNGKLPPKYGMKLCQAFGFTVEDEIPHE